MYILMYSTAIVTTIAASMQRLGEDELRNSGPWCWIKRDTQSETNRSEIISMLFTGKLWEVLCYLCTIALYTSIKHHTWKKVILILCLVIDKNFCARRLFLHLYGNTWICLVNLATEWIRRYGDIIHCNNKYTNKRKVKVSNYWYFLYLIIILDRVYIIGHCILLNSYTYMTM